MSAIWAKYNELLITRPLITKGLTGGSLFSTGDFLAQYLDGTLQSPSGYDPTRTAFSFLWSSCVFTPIGHNWYSKFLPKHYPTSSPKDLGMKMLWDQTAFAAGLNILYLTYTTITRGGTLHDAENKIRRDLWEITKTNWCLRPPIQLGTFYFVPLHLQMPVMNVIAIFWGCYLATIAHRGNEHHKEDIANAIHVATLNTYGTFADELNNMDKDYLTQKQSYQAEVSSV